MNRDDLRNRLPASGHRESSYSLDGYRDELTCLESRGQQWAVYYGERGQKILTHLFPDEDSACRYMLGVVTGNEDLNDR
ncbi:MULTISPECIES: hypothetical protein [unclassified Kitasatospora]|uniref:hypothetical protein n=1 Tax=unclassified Kitasatospora TaxID=2633591 RepID=UPI00070B92E1|nr:MULTISPECIES: hypothetical protein [unclassified Kitasatospora]KQV14295.1 hypothetical protein ASC99_32020 [Kitasatospora sp. Root107]KRB72371.1 hypothetical protein ASE03_22885 [Kitasatospora sp. Root187]